MPIQRGTDAVILFVLIPALLLALLYAQRGSRRARLLLAGLLVGFLYNAASTAFGVAFNPLFPLYVAYFSASLFAFVGLFATLAKESHADPHLLGTNIPRLGIAIFLGLSALSTLVWLFEIAPALAQGGAPATLAHYTTEVTALLDWGVVAPACLLAAVWLLRRHPLGVPLAAVMLVFMVLVGGDCVRSTPGASVGRRGGERRRDRGLRSTFHPAERSCLLAWPAPLPGNKRALAFLQCRRSSPTALCKSKEGGFARKRLRRQKNRHAAQVRNIGKRLPLLINHHQGRR